MALSNGSAFISDTSLHTINCDAVICVSDTKFAVLTDVNRTEYEGTAKLDTSSSPDAVLVLAGTTLIGSFTAIQLHEGAVYCKRG